MLGLFCVKGSDDVVDVSIFNNAELSILEAVCKYLKEQRGLRYSKIGVLLNRDQRTIWVTYHNAVRKREKPLEVGDSECKIPLVIFKDRKLSVLECLVAFLKEKYGLRYSEIARLIKRDERNIWGVYHRAKKK
ncbi:MAG: hypothetical protein ABIG95_04525 [Candidatus Woesearchaeota archaeon]